MTGFGRGSAATDAWQATIEISAVNRKQAEVVVQAPRELNELDARIRKAVLSVGYLGEMIEYGKTDEIFIKPKKQATEDYITGRFG